MTENQRNYLADLAGQKGIRLSDTDNWSVAKASEEIDRLKEMPDATFDDITEEEIEQIDKVIECKDEITIDEKEWNYSSITSIIDVNRKESINYIHEALECFE